MIINLLILRLLLRRYNRTVSAVSAVVCDVHKRYFLRDMSTFDSRTLASCVHLSRLLLRQRACLAVVSGVCVSVREMHKRHLLSHLCFFNS